MKERKVWHDAAGEELGPDAFLGSVVVPYVIERLTEDRSQNQDSELWQLFTVLEELMGDENAAVPNLVEVSFCEQLLANTEAFEAALHYMGPKTRNASLFIKRRLVGS